MNIAANVDNSGLEVLGKPGSFIIGSVDEVNGKGAREVPQFVPTRAELLELVKYWESTYLKISLFEFETHQTGSEERRLRNFAERRADRIVGLLGPDAVEAVEEVRKEFEREVGGQKWKRFRAYCGL